MKQIIQQIKRGQFKIYWDHPQYRAQVLNLNFNGLVNQLHIPEDTVLLHWQAKPKGLRRWGVYSVEKDDYFSVNHNKLLIGNNLTTKVLQINEIQTPVMPTAVVAFWNSKIVLNEAQKIVKVVSVTHLVTPNDTQ